MNKKIGIIIFSTCIIFPLLLLFITYLVQKYNFKNWKDSSIIFIKEKSEPSINYKVHKFKYSNDQWIKIIYKDSHLPFSWSYSVARSSTGKYFSSTHHHCVAFKIMPNTHHKVIKHMKELAVKEKWSQKKLDSELYKFKNDKNGYQFMFTDNIIQAEKLILDSNFHKLNINSL